MVVVSSYYHGEKSAENEGCLTGLQAVAVKALAAVATTVVATMTVDRLEWMDGLVAGLAASAVVMAAVVVMAAGAVEAAVAPVIIIAIIA